MSYLKLLALQCMKQVMEQRINWDIPILMCTPPPSPLPHNFSPPKNDRFLKSGVQNFSLIKPTKFIPFSFSKGANKKISSSDSSLGWWRARVTDKNGMTHTAVRLIRTLFYCTPDLILYSIVFFRVPICKMHLLCSYMNNALLHGA